MKVSGKVAVVFGGARGIGRACVELLLKEGAKVCIADILEETGSNTQAELVKTYPEQVTFAKCDITDEKQVEDVYAKTEATFGKPEIIMNTSAIVNEQQWKRAMEVNYGGVICSTLKAFDVMSKDKGGKGGVIIHTSSLNGLTPSKYHPVYVGTKHAIIGFVQSFGLPEHVSRTGVRVNGICPGTCDTLFLKELTTYFMEDFDDVVPDTFQYVKPEECAEGMFKLIEDDTMSGDFMICATKGIFKHEKTREKFYASYI